MKTLDDAAADEGKAMGRAFRSVYPKRRTPSRGHGRPKLPDPGARLPSKPIHHSAKLPVVDSTLRKLLGLA